MEVPTTTPTLQVPLNEAVSPKEQLLKQVSTQPNVEGGLFAQLKANPLFTAGFGLVGLGAALGIAQKGVRHGAALVRRRLLVDLEINKNDASYYWFLQWMSQYQRAQISGQASVFQGSSEAVAQAAKPSFIMGLIQRFTPGLHHLSIQTSLTTHPNGSSHTNFALIPGPGRHFLRYRNTFIAVNRVRETKSIDMKTGQPWETVTLTTLYSHRHIFEDLFTEAHDLAAQLQEGKTVVYTAWGTDWKPFGKPRRKRPLESVILDQGVKEKIVQDVKDFMQSAKWYFDRGIPYRRGYLLHGPPGTGKSSFLYALAGSLDYDIALLNLSERGLTDDRFNHLLSNIPKRTLVLLEDVDAAFANRRQVEQDGYQGANVTFSGLLNALDGVASAEERIVFLTTNHVERLDAALVRPGRVDMTVHLGMATQYQAAQLWDRFYGDLEGAGEGRTRFLSRLLSHGIVEDDLRQIKLDNTNRTSTAALQGLFLYNKGDMEGAINMVESLVPNNPSRQVSETPQEQDRSPVIPGKTASLGK